VFRVTTISLTNDTKYFNLILDVATHKHKLHILERGLIMVTVELSAIGVMSEELIEKIQDFIKINVELISCNDQKYKMESFLFTVNRIED
jgi:hypothetical protein